MTEIKMSRAQKIVVGLLCLGAMLMPSVYLLHQGLTENLGSQTIDPDGRVDWGQVLFLFLAPLGVGIPLSVLALSLCLFVVYMANRLRGKS